MPTSRFGFLGICVLLGLALASTAACEESAAVVRRQRAMEFHARAQQPSGILLPLYIYPAGIHTNAAYNRVMSLKRKYETVPMWVIVNPASGPGEKVDANYTKAIDRLCGAGCVVLGYISTSYGKRKSPDVCGDIDLWLKLYPRIHGIFFDEMIYEDTAAGVEHQAALNHYAHASGCWPTVGNPGADTPGRYFEQEAADVIVVHEGAKWPTVERLHGDYFGGDADYPPFTRGVLLHSQAKLDTKALLTARPYARWWYVTEAPFRADDPQAANPWDRVSKHLEELLEELQR